MKVLSWLRDLVLGKNGYVAEEQEEEIQQIKDESQSCLDNAQAHLNNMSHEFTKLHRKDDSADTATP
jgi:hypothetical protein